MILDLVRHAGNGRDEFLDGRNDPPQLARSAASEEEALRHYRRVRDEIRAFVEGFPSVLVAGSQDR